MSITPAGSLSIALVKLQRLVAASATFQAAVGAGDATEALEKVLLDYLESDDMERERPFAIVAEAEHGYTQLGEGVGIDLGAGGGLIFHLTANSEHRENHNDSKIAFTNFAGQVIDEMAALSGQDEYFPMRGCELITPALRTVPTKRNDKCDYWWIEWSIQFGVLGG